MIMNSEDILASGSLVLDIGRRIMAEASRGVRVNQLSGLARELTHAANRLRIDAATYAISASADTHPKDGDVEQAPLVSGAVPQGDAQ